MKDITFYDFNFNRLGDFPRCISVNITKNYCGYGTAEIHLSFADYEIVKLLEDNPYVFFMADGYSAIVTGWMVDTDIAVFGRTPEWLLTKRGIQPISQTNSTPEEIAREAISSAAGDFITLEDIKGIGTAQDYSTEDVRVLHDVLCEVLNVQKLGFEVVPNIELKQFIFRVYNGTERPVVLSRSNRTAYDMSYMVEKQDQVTNSGWYKRKFVNMGEWAADSNTPKLTNNQKGNFYTYYKITVSSNKYFGLACKEGEYLYCDTADGSWKTSADKPEDGWVYIDNTEVNGAQKWDAVLSGTKAESEATAEILQLVRTETLTTKVRNAEFGIDYGLGDIVSVHLEFGEFKKSVKKRVTSVNICEDMDIVGVAPVLSGLEE